MPDPRKPMIKTNETEDDAVFYIAIPCIAIQFPQYFPTKAHDGH